MTPQIPYCYKVVRYCKLGLVESVELVELVESVESVELVELVNWGNSGDNFRNSVLGK